MAAKQGPNILLFMSNRILCMAAKQGPNIPFCMPNGTSPVSLAPSTRLRRRKLQEELRMENNRTIPEWGRAIFSDLCVIMRPVSSDDVRAFVGYAIALTRTHLQIARLVRPVEADRLESSPTLRCSLGRLRL
jgi:hypothetical protein